MGSSIDHFNPSAYDPISDISGNGRVTFMLNHETNKPIVRKQVSRANAELYKRLVHIRHENLVQVLGVEEAGDCCYSYEEYIDGETLLQVAVSEQTACEWISQLCRAVRVLHGQNPAIIHRDIKPTNIMLTNDGVIKLIDFDAAKSYTPNKQRDTELIGTPDYAAPEQYGFAQSDPRTDVYAIGVLFHELLTGYKPNEGKATYKGRYGDVINRCVEIDPKMRYRSVQELERQLRMHEATWFARNVPGFRTGTWWKKSVACALYIAMAIIMVAGFCAEWELSGSIANSLAFPLFLIISFAPPYMLIANFMRLRDKLPLLRSRSVRVKVLGLVLYLVAWLLLVVIYLTIVAD